MNLTQTFEALHARHVEIGKSSVKERKRKLKKLEKAILHHRPDIKKAMFLDFRKPAEEVDVTEVLPLLSEIRHTRRHLGQWLQDRRVPTPLPLLGSSSRVARSAKGVVLILSPWNYPLQLTFGPLVGAIAGGNTVMLKPSEFTPHTSQLIQKLIADNFPADEITVVTGDADTAKEILQHPFHHIFFTGSPRVGKLIMKAAAEHLSSVTLELGGKSPVVVDRSASLDAAARRIAIGKYLNAGQTCIAPDYVLAHESIADELGEKIRQQWEQFASRHDSETQPAYSAMIHREHFERQQQLLEGQAGKNIMPAKGRFEQEKNYLPPTLVYRPVKESELMQEEIFGPLLPVLTFQNLREVTEFIRSKDRPLVTYLFTQSRKTRKHIRENISSGALCINHTLVYFLNNNLPFGGINGSGFGKSHGIYALREFTHERAIFRQRWGFSVPDLLIPPYNNLKRRMIEFSVKYL